MNILLVEEHEVQGSTVRLTDNRALHIVKILKSSPGDTVRVGMVNGRRGIGVIEEVSRRPRYVVIRLDLVEEMEPAPLIDLVVAMARPIMMRRILSQAAAMGVGHFYCINANRVEKSFWDSSLLQPDNYSAHLRSGLEQSVATRMPGVTFFRRFRIFAEDYMPGVMSQYSKCIVAHPTGETSLAACLEGVKGRVLVAIGPEGGWVDYEIEQFSKAGWSVSSLGRRILKVDTAVVAMHARVSEILGSV